MALLEQRSNVSSAGLRDGAAVVRSNLDDLRRIADRLAGRGCRMGGGERHGRRQQRAGREAREDFTGLRGTGLWDIGFGGSGRGRADGGHGGEQRGLQETDHGGGPVRFGPPV